MAAAKKEDLYERTRKLRRIILTAIAADDVLSELLVLKGGNALEIAHNIGQRASLDMDFSMENDIGDLQGISDRLFRSLKDRLDADGYFLFDEKMAPRPPTSKEDPWGGYRAEFKVITKEKHRTLGGNPEAIRRDAEITSPEQGRIFKIDISKFEYCAARMQVEIDAYPIFAYTPEMIAIEKLRAICQQMGEYPRRAHPAPRPRDFYDIHATVTARTIDLASEENRDLLAHVFRAKEVDQQLLSKVAEYRAFHEQGWPSVRNSVTGPLEPFDYYFDFVLREIGRLLAAASL